ncbi:MAG: hypothetical protein GY839_01965 [candidate division Zixibacteria bacterium]|nr:hypothetical protein [candidate division Zixibacteria bacterium]
MNDADLEKFYKFIAFGELDNALDFIKEAGPVEDDADLVIVQALYLKKHLEKYICLEPV